MLNYKLIEFNEYKDQRGILLPLELNNNCPFDIKRVFIIYGVPNSNIERGNHKNKNSQLLLIALKGKVSVEILELKKSIRLDSPNKGLYLKKDVRKRLYDFSDDAVLLCLSDNYYNPNDYI